MVQRGPLAPTVTKWSLWWWTLPAICLTLYKNSEGAICTDHSAVIIQLTAEEIKIGR